MKIDEKNTYLIHRTVCKTCRNKNRRKNNKNTSSGNEISASHQQPLLDNVNNNNRTLIIGFSNCGKSFLMNYILLQKHEPIFIITKSLNQYPNIKAQTSDEIQQLEIYEDSTVVFHDMLLSKQESNIGLFFTRGRHDNIDIYYVSQSYFHLPKILFVILSISFFI